jgi:hypothetical protein
MLYGDPFISQWLSQKVETWVKAGQRAQARPTEDNRGWVVEPGPRYRIQLACVVLVFTAACGGVLYLELIGKPLKTIYRWGYALFMFPAFIAALTVFLRALLVRVELYQWGMSERLAGLETRRLRWAEITSVKFRTVFNALVFKSDATSIIISLDSDGLARLREYLAKYGPQGGNSVGPVSKRR